MKSVSALALLRGVLCVIIALNFSKRLTRACKFERGETSILIILTAVAKV